MIAKHNFINEIQSFLSLGLNLSHSKTIKKPQRFMFGTYELCQQNQHC